ncbi:enoyl-CoA hydratase [Peribacillus loiseleuriae]|uniref:Enoyl-CoA hydratase n=1 Tax=Peribacillus loiseleuriae TaxID=1679170 RepID=A0A0K9GTB7_9BACI|nr:enoyl-CoA hydratase [Peribacillus loiseleuriae]KMY49868.1 enoyl-CoA hydratase [Peribacillus loiseleuriae]
MSNLIKIANQENFVTVVTLNRPATANALSVNLLKEFNHVLETVTIDPTVRCIIITGTGNKVFCAGADLKERMEMDEVQVRRTVELIRNTMDAVQNLPVPVIAAINGAAFGGGLELALACDIRLASTTAKMGLTETSLGIIPGAGGTQRLPRIVGVSFAKELIFTARRIDAEEALKLGILNKITEADQLMNKALELAAEISRNAPLSLKAAKKAINEGIDMEIARGLEIEKRWYDTIIESKDRLEGLQAFKEKRRPLFTGK